MDSIARGLAVRALVSSQVTTSGAKRASHLATSLTAVKNNVADMIIMLLSDSTGAGMAYGDAGSGQNVKFANAVNWGLSARICERLRQLGIPATHDAWFGTQVRDSVDSIVDTVAYDPRRTAGGFAVGTVRSLGGYPFRKASATPGAGSFAAQDPCDSFDLFYTGNSGDFTANVDGGGATTWSAPGGAIVPTVRNLPAASVGIHTLNYDTTSGNTANVLGVIARNSTRKRVIVVNASQRGISASVVAADGASPGIATKGMISYLVPALGIIGYGINDIRTGGGSNASVGSMTTHLNTLIASVSAVGNVMLLAPHRFAPSEEGSGATMEQLNALYRSLAAAGGHSFVDAGEASGGGYAYQNAKSTMYDTLHFGDRGIAQLIGYKAADTLLASAIAAGFSPA